MRIQKRIAGDGKLVYRQHPAVHNLIFIQIDSSIEEMKIILSGCPYPISVYTQNDNPEKWFQINNKEMFDIRLMCDNSFIEPTFFSPQEYELKEGAMVRVAHGPMAGICGKLIRKNKKYFIVRAFSCFGIAVTVSRWCCVPIKEQEQIL